MAARAGEETMFDRRFLFFVMASNWFHSPGNQSDRVDFFFWNFNLINSVRRGADSATCKWGMDLARGDAYANEKGFFFCKSTSISKPTGRFGKTPRRPGGRWRERHANEAKRYANEPRLTVSVRRMGTVSSSVSYILRFLKAVFKMIRRNVVRFMAHRLPCVIACNNKKNEFFFLKFNSHWLNDDASGKRKLWAAPFRNGPITCRSSCSSTSRNVWLRNRVARASNRRPISVERKTTHVVFDVSTNKATLN